jgi:hypothetical protein
VMKGVVLRRRMLMMMSAVVVDEWGKACLGIIILVRLMGLRLELMGML